MRRAAIAILSGLVLASVVPSATEARAAVFESYLLQVDGLSRSEVAARVADSGGTLLRMHSQIGFALALSNDPDFQLAAADSGIVVAPNRMLPPAEGLLAGQDRRARPVTLPVAPLGAPQHGVDPTDAIFFGCQWQLDRIDTEGAWAQGALGDPDVRVAMLSTGIDFDHIEVVGKVDLEDAAIFITPGTSPCPELGDETSLLDFGGFGTGLASLIAGNSFAIAAVAPRSRIVPVKVSHCEAGGTVADVVAGVLYAADLPRVEVIHLSLRFYLETTPQNRPLIEALRRAASYARRKGKLLVVGAGDQSTDLTQNTGFIALPAELPSAFAVYAVARALDSPLDRVTNFGFPTVRLGAPSGQRPPNPGPPLLECQLPEILWTAVLAACSSFNVTFPCPPNTYFGIGNSATAALLVAGTALLMDGEVDGRLPPGALAALLTVTADDIGPPGVDHDFGFGRVNAARAVAAVPPIGH